jgi:hypothetical protein
MNFECSAGSHRGFVNQHPIGVISSYTLRDILKMGSEHLWICVLSSEDGLLTKD